MRGFPESSSKSFGVFLLLCCDLAGYRIARISLDLHCAKDMLLLYVFSCFFIYSIMITAISFSDFSIRMEEKKGGGFHMEI